MHVVETIERMPITSVDEMTCEELCYTVAGTLAKEYNVTQCSQELDEILFEEDFASLDQSLLVGSVTCTGNVLNYQK